MFTMAKTAQPTLQHLDPASLTMTDQVRKDRNEQADKELLASITKRGVLQPVRARKVGDKLVIIDGHRRTEAAQAAKLETIPVYIVADQLSHDVLTDQMVANIQREDMSIKDTAEGVLKLYKGPGGGSATFVAEKLAKPNSWVSKMLVIAGHKKPAPITSRLLAADKVTDLEAAYMLAKIEDADPAAAEAIAKNIVNEDRASIKKKLASVKAPAQATKGGDAEEETDYTEALQWALEVIRKATVSKKTAPLQALADEYLSEVVGEEAE
jgi:ParB family transcriptional regulator, chromosome partitioning protein